MKYAPSSLAKTTSGTVVILITSAFQERNMKLSARDENLGPSIVTTVPEIIGKVRITVFLAQYIIVNGDKLNRRMFFNAKNFKFQIFFLQNFT